MTDNKLTHFDASGNAVMVDVSEKTVTFREATAHGIITMNAEAFAAVQNKFFGRKTEIVVLLILDSKGYLKYMGIVNEGSVHGVPIYIRQIARLCLLYDADAVYLAHNHPSGNCTPSRQDIQTTKEIELALSGIDVILSDHFIFTDEDYLSMRATGVLQKLRHDIATLKRQIIT